MSLKTSQKWAQDSMRSSNIYLYAVVYKLGLTVENKRRDNNNDAHDIVHPNVDSPTTKRKHNALTMLMRSSNAKSQCFINIGTGEYPLAAKDMSYFRST